MKKALVCGAGGFIGGHLVTRLKKEGYFVRGVDIKEHEYKKTDADEFLSSILDQRKMSERHLMAALMRCINSLLTWVVLVTFSLEKMMQTSCTTRR